MSERIGYYICHCGINIASKVRCAEVAEYIGAMDDVIVSRDYLFMCSDPGQELIEKDVAEHKLTRVVVASCSPRMHENTFRTACTRAGLNPFRAFHHVCLREHVSWVHTDEDTATEKAKILSRAGVLRVVRQHDLHSQTFPVNTNTLVVGGGIAGMQASLDIVKAGFKAYLVEKTSTIGGHMLQYDKTFPTLDCAACIGTPKMVSVGQSPNIELLSLSEVEEVSGFIGNFKVRVRKKARYVDEKKCTGCGECVKACPVTMPNEWDEGLQQRNAIYRLFPQAVPITFAIEKMDRGPCVQTCPAGTNVQGYVALIMQGKYEEAVKLIMQRLPLPGTLGRVCPAPCEAECRCKEIEEAVSIRVLKRFAADQVDLAKLPVPLKEVKEDRVAIVGAGPAGLSAAYYLALDGYPVTVFESLRKAGGMLRAGIPEYRLPRDILDRELAGIERVGVTFEYEKRLGRDFTIEDLRKQGYKAVFMGIGAYKGAKLGLEGEDEAEGIHDCIDFLMQNNLEGRRKAGNKVLVIGGGNAAMDSARVSVRVGSDVHLLYRRTRAEMPATPEEVEAAVEEGIAMQFLVSPVGLLVKDGKMTGLRCIRNELGEPDKSGRRRPVPVAGSEFDIEADAVICAIGQSPDMSWMDKDMDFKLTRWGTLEVDPETMQTSRPDVFAAGDAVTGPATVVEAIAGGREAAISIDRFLRGVDLKEDRPPRPTGGNWAPIPKTASARSRARPAELEPDKRKNNFDEVELPFTEEQAKAEAARCIACGSCSECMACVEKCEAKAIIHDQQDEIRELDVGSIIIATGFNAMDPSGMDEYGYGRYANVLTNLEFERLSNATGPTGGKILMRDAEDRYKFTDPPEAVAILHCIGSRDTNYHEYCSRTCCMYALKYAHLIKDKVGHEAQVFNFYIDMRCFGKGYEEFMKRIQSEGVRFIRGKAACVTDQAECPEEEDKLTVVAEDTLTNTILRVPVDMVVLCTAMEAREDALDVARCFGISEGADGFFLEEHPKLEPVSTATSGVFIAGACQGPKDIPDTVAQAKGAASEALALSAAGKVTVSPMISTIDPDICIGCQVCIGLCAYTAIAYDERHRVSVVNEAVCKGCGSCAGYCPSGAAKIRHFTDSQIFREIDGILG